MFDRIVGQCPPDFFSQPSTNVSYTNVNTRQREMKKPELPPSVEQFIKKGNIINNLFLNLEH